MNNCCTRCFAGRDVSSICCICEQLGKRIIHGTNGCPMFTSMPACRRCFQKGHLTKCCIVGHIGLERPASLEELIPVSVRRAYGIHTHTPITWTRLDRTSDEEIHVVNSFRILDTYAGMKEFIELHNIPVKKKTKESTDECRTAIEEWVKRQACRLEFVSSVDTVAE